MIGFDLSPQASASTALFDDFRWQDNIGEGFRLKEAYERAH